MVLCIISFLIFNTFDIEKWLWKSEFWNFTGLINSIKNVKTKIQWNFGNLCIMHIDGLLINLRTRTIFSHRKSKQLWKQTKYQSLKCFFNIDIWRLPWRKEFDAEVWLQIRKNTYVLHVINSATSRQNNSFSLNLG